MLEHYIFFLKTKFACFTFQNVIFHFSDVFAVDAALDAALQKYCGIDFIKSKYHRIAFFLLGR